MSEYSEEYRRQNFYVGFELDRGPAWWSTGHPDEKRFPGAIPLDSARELIGFAPVQVPMLYRVPGTGELREYDGPRIVLNDQTNLPLGYNGGSSNLFSPWEWFIQGPATLLDTHTSDLGLGFVGLFKDGAVSAVQIELAKTIVDDFTGTGYRPFLYAATALDGSMIPQYGRGYTRIVCDNTFAMARGEARGSGLFYGVKQTKNRKVDFNAARQALDIVHDMTDEISAEFRELAQTTVTDRQWYAFLDSYIPLPEPISADKPGRAYTLAENKRDKFAHLWNFDNRVSPWKGTAFGVAQAVTTYGQHMSTIRGDAGRMERNKMAMIAGKASAQESDALNLLGRILANA